MTRRLSVLALLSTVVLATASATQPAPQSIATDPRFRVSLKATITHTADGEQEKLAIDASFEYTWKREGNLRILLLESVALIWPRMARKWSTRR